MRKGIRMIGLLVGLVGLFSRAAWANDQSADVFTVAHPNGTMEVHLKAVGFPVVDTTASFLSTDTAQQVARKAATALCNAILNGGIDCSVANCGGAAPNCTPADAVDLNMACCGGGADGTKRFNFNNPAVSTPPKLSFNTAVGNVANVNLKSQDYPDLGSDVAARVLLQLRPNYCTGSGATSGVICTGGPGQGTCPVNQTCGILGTVQVRIHHNQGGQNPKTASFTITAGNLNDSQAIHNGIRDAINALAFNPDVVAVTHSPDDAKPPLTYFPATYSSAPVVYFVEITNAAAAGVTDVEVVPVQGQGVTIEGTENIMDTPALSSWGILLVVAMLLLSGYWLMRRRRGTATA